MIDISSWYKQNLWLSDANELVVRPAFREEAETSDGYEAVAGFSLTSPNTQEVFHYIFLRSASTGITTLSVTDEEYIEIYNGIVGPTPRRLVVSCATLATATTASLEVMICSPHFQSLYGLLGGGLINAEKVESVNPNTTAVDIPRGIAIGFSGRVVIGSGRNLFFSDAQAARTFVGINIASMNGTIYGLHLLAGGSLIIVTDSGTYSLPPDAVATGQQVLGIFDKLQDYSAKDYQQTAQVDGNLFGLSESGIRQINAAGQPEITLNEPRLTRAISEPIEESDYRSLTLWADDRGPIVSKKDSFARFDLAKGFNSWWIGPDGYDIEITGILQDNTNAFRYLTRDRIIRTFGNQELDESVITGVASGRVDSSPELSPVVRSVTTSSDTTGNQKAAVRGALKSADTPQSATEIGADSWSVTETYGEREMRSRRHLFAKRTDDITLEVAAENSGSRLGVASIETKGSGRRRPTN